LLLCSCLFSERLLISLFLVPASFILGPVLLFFIAYFGMGGFILGKSLVKEGSPPFLRLCFLWFVILVPERVWNPVFAVLLNREGVFSHVFFLVHQHLCNPPSWKDAVIGNERRGLQFFCDFPCMTFSSIF